MIIGLPKEIKSDENRVALVPSGVEVLVSSGHTVLVEAGAGRGSGFGDDLYRKAGADVVEGPKEIFSRAEMVVKVKEPLEREFPLIREDQILFTFYHFAADEDLLEGVRERKCIALAYETVQEDNGELPLLIPMSEVAGRMAVQEGAKYLEKTRGGKGVLLSGVPGVRPAQVTVLGGGIVGSNAAKMAAGLGARVTIFDINLERLRYLSDIMLSNVNMVYSSPQGIREALKSTDLLVGAVLRAGAKAPKLVMQEDLRLMEEGSVIVDVAVDQGGCIETCRPTTHSDPTYVVEGIIHYCVANMPGAVPKTSTLALTNATFPYVLDLANKGWKKACLEDRILMRGLNLVKSRITCRGVADAFHREYSDPNEIIGE
jgi:alanine dehydrogenase